MKNNSNINLNSKEKEENNNTIIEENIKNDENIENIENNKNDENEEKEENIKPILKTPEEFYKIINDFCLDLINTFPEYEPLINKWWSFNPINESQKELQLNYVFVHCLKIFPEQFFYILYKNDELFDENSKLNSEFLPGIVFKHLYHSNISEQTRETLWKYLQLILFAIIGSVNNSEDFGDSAKLFEAISEEELKSKLEETLETMNNIFENIANNNNNQQENGEDNSNVNLNQNSMPNIFNIDPSLNFIPNAEELHSHIQNMMGGKLGKLAMELAEETASDLNLEINGNEEVKDVFNQLFKNPGKLMNMVKNIGNKIDDKLKSGEIKESELIEEGLELLNKMKSMPGMNNFQQLFSQMGLSGLGGNNKINTNAMESQLNRNLKTAKMKERMNSKREKKKELKLQNQGQSQIDLEKNINEKNKVLSDEEIIKIFSDLQTNKKNKK